MKKAISYIQSSFDTHSQGASARKLTAFWIVMLITFLHISYFRYQAKQEGNYEYLPTILVIDFCFVAVALGLTTVETILKLKNGNSDNTSDTPK